MSLATLDLDALRASRQAAVDAARASRLATFARGGGGKSAKGKSSKKAKAKGAVQAGKGGACCKTEGGRFAPGNNYGSLAGKGSSAKVAANSARAVADKAARRASVRVEATRRGATPAAAIVARSQKATAMAARVKAARDHEKAARDKKDARNKAARERRAERAPKAEAAKADRGTREQRLAKVMAKGDKITDRRFKEVRAMEARRDVLSEKIRNTGPRAQNKFSKLMRERDAIDQALGKPYSRLGDMYTRMDRLNRERNALDEAAKVAKAGRASAIGRMVGKSRDATLKGVQTKAKREVFRDKKARAEKAEAAKADRAASLKRLTDKSRVASGKSGAENAARKRAAESPSVRSVADAARAAKGTSDQRSRAIMRKAEAEVFGLKQKYEAAKAKAKSLSKKVAGLDAQDKLQAVGIKFHRAIKRRDRVERQLHKLDVAAQGRAATATTATARSSSPASAPKPGAPANPASAAQVRAGKEAALAALGPRPANRSEGIQNDEATSAWLSRKQAIEAKFVPPVAPPPASLLARPLADPARMKAEVAKVEEAFNQAPGSRDNFVPLAAVQNALPHLSRREFVEVVNRARDRRMFGLDSHEGLAHPMAPELKAAGIEEGGSNLVYIRRRD